jgi:hypothetical protein
MKRKPIKIDWEDLEDAFNSPPEEIESYLDGITGHVVLEGEGEEDEDELDDLALPSVAVGSRRSDPTRLPIRPPGPEKKIEWMKAFIAVGGYDAEVIRGLERGVAAEDPPEVLSQVLNDNPEVRDAWYLYRTDRLREMIEEWLEANGIEAVTPPPWK